MDSIRDRSICILGLGYVGLTLATALADVGFEVWGVEIREDVLEKLRRGEPHFFEPGMKEKLERLVRTKRIHLSRHIPNECAATAFIITVGTPLGSNGKTRLDMIEAVSREVSRALKPQDIVILRSTVMLGTTRRTVLPILQTSGRPFDLAFCPERTLEGKALHELRTLPQIVGGLNFESTLRASLIFQMLTPTVVRVADLETAEVIKLIDNSQRDVWFAFSNEVARICDAAGVSAAQVISAGKLGYPRTHLAMPGPVGGPCLEKDPYILAEGLERHGITPEITLTARKVNERQPEEVVAALAAKVKEWPGFSKRPKVSLLGIAFKGRPATDDLRGTMARPIFSALQRHFPEARFFGFDPVVAKAEVQAFGLEPCSSLEMALDRADLALILNNHPHFGAMRIEDLANRMNQPSIIYDFWNSFTAKDLHLPAGRGYMALGSHGTAVLPGSVARSASAYAPEIDQRNHAF